MSKSRSSREPRTSRAPKASLATTIVVVVLVLGYIALRPVMERRFGIQLPSINGEQERSVERPKQDEGPRGTVANTSRSQIPATGSLRDVGGGVKESPAGLRYGPGSQEGHRWKHVLRHASDQPSRPGPHGVFDDSDEQLVAVIDEAYQLAKAGDRRAKEKRDGPRTIYTVDMQRRIGFVGGQVGDRQRHPPAHGVRLILEGRNVISAYPVRM
ncbi:MAG TPA: hypothetical protein VMX74_11935 [Pirellulales bacterium]|nr:hypothetical protein [Pirellulales bacterium]